MKMHQRSRKSKGKEKGENDIVKFTVDNKVVVMDWQQACFKSIHCVYIVFKNITIVNIT